MMQILGQKIQKLIQKNLRLDSKKHKSDELKSARSFTDMLSSRLAR